jgi:hypothetical protein
MTMKFEVIVHRTLFVTLEVEADSKEDAEKLVKEEIETKYEDIYVWNDYSQLEIEYDPPTPES